MFVLEKMRRAQRQRFSRAGAQAQVRRSGNSGAQAGAILRRAAPEGRQSGPQPQARWAGAIPQASVGGKREGGVQRASAH